MSTVQVVDNVIYGMDHEVAAWVAERVPIMGGRRQSDPNMLKALGVERDGEIIAGIVFRNYRAGVDIEVDLAADHPKWCRPTVLRRLFRYPFVQLELPRITCIVSASNERCRRLCEGRPGLGWRLEGVARKSYDGVSDAMIFGMLAGECRFLPTS